MGFLETLQKVAEDHACSEHHSRRGVKDSLELQRILALPRRVLPDVDLTWKYSKSGEFSLRRIQSQALHEAQLADGLFAPVAVGGGKSLIAFLLPDAMEAKNPLILTKPEVRDQMERERETFYGLHFNLPHCRIVSYNELSSAKSRGILDDVEPDLIIADEAHCLKNKESARTKRFIRYMNKNPGTRFCAMSGTMTSRSLLDYAHLIEFALGKNSPIPCRRGDLLEWAAALDAGAISPMPPGYLRLLCREGESTRSGFRRRLISTVGVVATSVGSSDTRLVVRRRSPQVPQAVKDLYRNTESSWALAGEEFDTALRLSNALRQISCGFYYKWDWPGGEVDGEWMEARAKWNREVRQKLKHSREGMDSPSLLWNAAEAFYTHREDAHVWESECWPAWSAVKGRWNPHPPRRTVWIDDFLAREAVEWAEKTKKRGIIWCQWSALAERVATLGNFPLYGQGQDASTANAAIIVCTTDAQGTGKNLQHHYQHNFFTTLPPNGKMVEQILGRTHRPGQKGDFVSAEWCAHTNVLSSAMDRVITDAQYTQGTTGQTQKILQAEHL